MTAPARRWPAIAARLGAYERLIRLDKPIGILLLLWPTLTGLWIASRGRPSVELILIFTVGTIPMRSAGCDFRFRGTSLRVMEAGLIP